MFSSCTVPPDSKETKLGSSNQEASLSADKNIGIALVSCCSWKCIPAAISGGVHISEVPDFICYDRYDRYLFYSMDRRCCLLHLIKLNYLLKTFLQILILMSLASLYLFFVLELT